MSKLFRMIGIGLIAVVLMAWSVASVWAASPPEPTYGEADVDGDYGEWNLSNDFFANMYQGGDPNKDTLSKLYLRYDCSTETLYALVRAEDDVDIEAFKSEEHWIRIDGNKEVDDTYGDNGTPPDFTWIARSGNYAQGWEASVSLTEGSYTLKVHTQVYEEIGDEHEVDQTSSTGSIDLEINCTGLANIGDYVWHDVNVNGVQDAGESGLDGVTVNLYSVTGTYTDTTQTDSSGYYIFDDLEPGDYYVEFVLPTGYQFTLQDEGADDAVDSDADPTTGKTGTINLSAGETDLTWDAGLHLCDIGDRVWHDEDGQGDQNTNPFTSNPEPGFNDVHVYLYDYQPTTCGETGYLEMTTTVSGTSQPPDDWPDGIYGFDMSTRGTGEYWVCVDEDTLPPSTYGWDLTTTAKGNPQQVNYTAGTDDFSIDFGYEPAGPPTAITLSSFAATSSAGGSASPLWLGLAGLAVLAAGSLFWAKRRAG